MITLLVPRGVTAGRREQVDEREEHHLRVRRAADGELVAIRDGAGLVGMGRLLASGRSWLVEIETAERRDRPAELTLAVGAGDRERFDWMVEKAVELGVTTIVPLETERTVGVASRLRRGQMPKLRTHALEAVKQCGAAWVPDILDPQLVLEYARQGPRGLGWLADAAGTAAPATLDGGAVTIVVGPEGGWSEHERLALLDGGFRPTALGALTLRFETAALAAAAVVGAARLRGAHG
ncbi:MAG TPA: RsmE family RNA methyltransferase [Gemmatimonadales bacterium]|nr:RsmE family RNA methyltransferase [Gemmatimonadales bacterium]